MSELKILRLVHFGFPFYILYLPVEFWIIICHCALVSRDKCKENYEKETFLDLHSLQR